MIQARAVFATFLLSDDAQSSYLCNSFVFNLIGWCAERADKVLLYPSCLSVPFEVLKPPFSGGRTPKFDVLHKTTDDYIKPHKITSVFAISLLLDFSVRPVAGFLSSFSQPIIFHFERHQGGR